jgi:NAD(P)-dependent dehydrogenase (short-subunit alcohol dehydrogenase family)
MSRLQKAKVVVVTGASAGVGRAVAQRFARDGAKVGLIARGRAGLEGAAEDVRRLGGTPLILPCDVADANAVEAAAERVERELGPIDVWVNNAMVSVFSPVREMQADEYRRVTEVTYLGSVYGTLSALKRMRQRDRGTIVQVSSALAFRSIPLQSAYCAAKHAVVGFLDSLRCELIHDGSRVRISAVHMPALNTPQFAWVRSRLPNAAQPVPPIFQPEVAADAVHWAAEHAPRDLDVGATTAEAIVGQKIIPGLLDRYLGKTGFDSQQTDQPRDPSQPDNLFEPVDDARDFGAHGSFDERASDHSEELWWAKHRKTLTAAAAVGLLGLAGWGVHAAMSEA